MSALSARAVRCGVAAAAAILLGAGLAPVASAQTPATIIRFQPETYADFKAQLANGEVHAITFNKVPHTVHVTLQDRQHLLAVYPPADYKKLYDQIKAAGIPILIEHPNGTPQPVHHRLRYIAAGVLVILIVVIAVVLMLNRRRAQEGDDAPAATPASAAGPPPPD